MALKVKDLLELDSFRGIELVSGKEGLDNIVCSAGIADYEFVPDIDYRNENAFEKDSFVISSLLFAKNDETRILEAVKKLYEFGTAAFAFKRIIFDSIPQEVIEFSEEKKYPIFSFGEELYFENIIYDITDAVQQDDTQILSEDSIKRMIDGQLSREEVYRIAKSVSLLFSRYVVSTYVRPESDGTDIDMTRIFRNYYISKKMKQKCIVCGFDRGLFIIITSPYDEEEKFRLIFDEVAESLSLDLVGMSVSRSGVHRPYEELDRCLRESYYTYIASETDGRKYDSYRETGMFRYLIPNKDARVFRLFSDDIMKPLEGKEELFTTCMAFVKSGGDIGKTAAACCCHQNTIRYRLMKIKETVGYAEKSDMEFYADLFAAVRIYLLRHKPVTEK